MIYNSEMCVRLFAFRWLHRKSDVIPNATNNFTFERVKAPKIDDRKWHCIELYYAIYDRRFVGSFHAAQI